MHGIGKYIFNNGNIYEGTFNNGLRHGAGKMTWVNGKIFSGNWDQNQMVDGLVNGQ